MDHDAQVSRKAISLHRTAAVAEEVVGAVPVPRHAEVEDVVARQVQARVDPHLGQQAGVALGTRLGDLLSQALALGVAWNHDGRRAGQEHAATRVVDAHAQVLLDQPGHVRDEGRNDELDLADEVQQR